MHLPNFSISANTLQWHKPKTLDPMSPNNNLLETTPLPQAPFSLNYVYPSLFSSLPETLDNSKMVIP
jgi:hypothetical protein